MEAMNEVMKGTVKNFTIDGAGALDARLPPPASHHLNLNTNSPPLPIPLTRQEEAGGSDRQIGKSANRRTGKQEAAIPRATPPIPSATPSPRF